MTTTWKITPAWEGETVAVLAGGPGMSLEVASEMRERGYRTIVINGSHKLLPWADMLVALDGNWPADYRAFAGERVTGVDDDELDALYAGPFWESVELAPGNIVSIRNSTLAAVRIAAALGARSIVVCGFAPATPGYWYGAGVPEQQQYTGVAEGLAAITAELGARGVAVELYQPEPADE